MSEEIEHNCGVAAVVLLRDAQDSQKYPYGVLPKLRQLMRVNQPRGRDGAGILTIREGRVDERIISEGPVERLFHAYTKTGLRGFLERYNCQSALGHNRYTTSGNDDERLLQPWLHNDPHQYSRFGFCFNGNIANWREVRTLLEEIGNYEFSLNIDTEVLEMMLRHELRAFNPRKKETLEQKLREGTLQSDETLARAFLENLSEREKGEQEWKDIFYHLANVLDGGWTLALARSDPEKQGEFVFARDAHGLRPGYYSIDERRGIFAFSSESAGLESILPRGKMRELPPGHILRVYRGQVEGPVDFTRGILTERSPCFLEDFYFQHVNTRASGEGSHPMTNYDVRYRAGQLMAENDPLREIVQRFDTAVVGVPNAALAFTEGLAEGLGLSARQNIVKFDSGRTFTNDSDNGDRGIPEAYSFSSTLRGKRIILADDSIVRLNTLPEIIARIYLLDPSEIHIRIGTPPIVGICPYGINIRTLDELSAVPFEQEFRRMKPEGSIDEMIKHIEQKMIFEIERRARRILKETYELSDEEIERPIVASLRYLSHENLDESYRKVETIDGVKETDFDGKLCRGCITGRYPTKAGQRLYDAQRTKRE